MDKRGIPVSKRYIKLYDGLLHDLFEPERKEIGQDIINWMEKRLSAFYVETTL